jgi:hypothetical protein
MQQIQLLLRCSDGLLHSRDRVVKSADLVTVGR